MTKIQFIPGLGEKPKDYKSLSKSLEIIDVDWNTWNTKPNVRPADMLVGFSMGNFVAIWKASKHKYKTLIFCSLTPGCESLKTVNADQIIFLVGEKEKWVLKDIRRTKKTFPGKTKLIIVPHADHKIDKLYQKMLLEAIDSIK